MSSAILSIYLDDQAVGEVRIDGEVVIGRSEDCGVRLDHRSVSRRHAVLKPEGDGFKIESQSEFAPIKVNGKESGEAVLHPGDVVGVGPYQLKLRSAEVLSTVTPIEMEQESVTTVQLDTDPVPVDTVEPPVPADADFQADFQSDFQPEVQVEAPSDVLPDLSLALDGGIASPPEESGPEEIGFQEVSHDEATRVLQGDGLEARLTFSPGSADVAEYVISKDEVMIGRGRDSDVVLEDKKASRKSASIVRSGRKFILKDLGSSNGIQVNGVKVVEQEMASGDVVRIGDTEFVFQAKSQEYARKEAGFLDVPDQDDGESPVPDQYPAQPFSMQSAAASGRTLVGGIPPASFGTHPGIPLPGKAGKGSLVDQFKALPPRKRAIYAALLVVGAWFMLSEDPSTTSGPARQPATNERGTADSAGVQATFDKLNGEQQRYVKAQYDLALKLYKDGEYDKSIFEIQKIFQMVPDYLDAREIERYAQEGKRKLEALQEERRKREEIERVKARVALLMEDARELMKRKEYDSASRVFPEILALDPENTEIAKWVREIEAEEDRKRADGERKMIQQKINDHGWELLAEAVNARKGGDCVAAIRAYRKVKDIGATQKKLLTQAATGEQECRSIIEERTAPLIENGRMSETNGDFVAAFKSYEEALKVDPGNTMAKEGTTRNRQAIEEKAKVLYTEAVLAESYSDFKMAKTRFKEVLDTAPEGSLYHGRARRKLMRYGPLMEREAPSQQQQEWGF